MRCKPVCCTRVRKVRSSLRFLGDRVGYGAQPAEVLDCIMAVQAEGAQALGANHVQFMLAPLSHDLSAVLLVHASANEPERWLYGDKPLATPPLDAARAWPQVRYEFGGHVHAQTLYYRGAMG